MSLLDLLAVDERAHGQVLGVDVRGVDHDGAERAEAVLALDPQHRAAVGVAEVVDAPVVGDGVSGHVIERVLDGRLRAAPADDDGDLALVVEATGSRAGARRRRRGADRELGGFRK